MEFPDYSFDGEQHPLFSSRWFSSVLSGWLPEYGYRSYAGGITFEGWISPDRNSAPWYRDDSYDDIPY